MPTRQFNLYTQKLEDLWKPEKLMPVKNVSKFTLHK